MRRSRVLLAAVSVALLASGCTAGDGGRGSRPPADSGQTASPLSWHDCTADIEASFLSRHRCGTLVVPQDRTGGRTHAGEIEAVLHRATVARLAVNQ